MSNHESARISWPRPGLALVPAVYRDAWYFDPLPDVVLSKAGLPSNTVIGQLDATVWERGNKAGLRLLASHLLALAKSRLYFGKDPALSRSILGGSWRSEIKPASLPFSTRTQNVLASSGKISDLEWLATATAQDFLALRNAGVLTLIDFATVAEAYRVVDMSTAEESPQSQLLIAGLTDVFGRLQDTFPLRNIGTVDPRLKSFSLPPGWLQERLAAFVEHASSSGNAEQIETARRTLLDLERTLGALSKAPLDRALTDLLSQVLSAKYVPVLAARLGWDGAGGCTLEAASESVGVTRERVRQLEGRVIERLPSSCYLPSLDRAIEILSAAAIELHPNPADLLAQSGVTSVAFLPEGVRTAAKLFQRPIRFEVGDDGRGVQLPGDGQLVPFRDALRSLTSVNYIASILEFQARIQDAGGGDVSVTAAKAFLDRYPATVWLDADHAWFWFRQKGDRNRFVNLARKILSVSGEASIETLRQGVLRPYRSRASSLPRHVFQAWCRAAGFLVDSNGIVSSPEDLSDQELSPIEQSMVELLRKNEGVMSYGDLRDAMIHGGVNRHTFTMYMISSPLLERVAPSIYALRGARVDPTRVAALVGMEKPYNRSLQDHGWTNDGGIWLGYRVTANLFDTGVIGIPATVAKLIGDARFDALSVDGATVGTLVIRRGTAWGVGPFIGRRGVEEGDTLIVAIDTELGVAVLQSGTDELLENYCDGEGWGPRRILESTASSEAIGL